MFYFFERRGLEFLTCIVVVIGARELINILFKPEESKSNRFFFYICTLATFLFSCLFFGWSSLFFAIFSILFCLFTLVTQRKFEDLEHLSNFQARGVLGIFYIGLLPSFAFQIIELPEGVSWFLTLLAVVFAGDIGAYLVGVKFGKTKIMPSVSPKKSVQGAFGGILFSLFAMIACSKILPPYPLVGLIALALCAGVVAQFGDFFESLLKRVADVKDSGRLMPGHGGMLDRMDGILFASPIILFGAILLDKYFS
ncbi:MAG: phosphatidate cytidylyltransferase [Bdellovibrionota bacterium]